MSKTYESKVQGPGYTYYWNIHGKIYTDPTAKYVISYVHIIGLHTNIFYGHNYLR